MAVTTEDLLKNTLRSLMQASESGANAAKEAIKNIQILDKAGVVNKVRNYMEQATGKVYNQTSKKPESEEQVVVSKLPGRALGG